MADAVDLLVIGGGINGAGIARDAAGRGLSVVLCEKGDLAEATSSRSSKLIHGGLRYLEYYQFRLVHEALVEREVLLRSAPHVVWPTRFVLPHSPQDRPVWMLRIGLFLYDHIGGRRTLPGCRALDLSREPEGAALLPRYVRGFEYPDCCADDARLTILSALDARERGARVLTRTLVESARRDGGLWRATVVDAASGERREIAARALVNAAGPWVDRVIDRIEGARTKFAVKLVKGSHIVTPKFFDGPQAYLVQNHDRRVIFVIPYQGDLALIGTTDIPFEGAPETVVADEEEIVYLLAAVAGYFRNAPKREDVIEAWSGVRPLFDDGHGDPSAITRDYVLELDAADGAPLLNVFGGKITTFRRLAEHALQKLKPFFPTARGDWTAQATLPGGEIDDADFERFVARFAREYSFLPPSLARHFARLYGTRALKLLGAASSIADLGRRFGPEFFEIEARYLVAEEWAQIADDILVRRTKHGLRMTADERAEFERWIESRADSAAC
ncbi:MAG: glycerol-3-phosphate dehydrogenase [Roseiarcus sp.]|jgi:glycerol-3-phosphate dehydrogenase